jgi:hypothetical protein
LKRLQTNFRKEKKMKLPDLLDTKPFNALSIVLLLLVATSIILTPYAVRGSWRDVAVKVSDISLSVSFDALGRHYDEDALNLADYVAWQSVAIQI